MCVCGHSYSRVAYPTTPLPPRAFRMVDAPSSCSMGDAQPQGAADVQAVFPVGMRVLLVPSEPDATELRQMLMDVCAYDGACVGDARLLLGAMES